MFTKLRVPLKFLFEKKNVRGSKPKKKFDNHDGSSTKRCVQPSWHTILRQHLLQCYLNGRNIVWTLKSVMCRLGNKYVIFPRQFSRVSQRKLAPEKYLID